MAGGTIITRTWIVTLTNGSFVIDWGDDLFQDIQTGEFMTLTEAEISHPITNDELEWLKRIGRIDEYTTRKVSILSLPERPQKTID